MKLAGGSVKHNNECSLDEFIRQAQRYQDLDEDSLNQVYKFLLYNNITQGVFLSHPFTVERVRYLQEWAASEEYRLIRSGNYPRARAEGAVEVEVKTPNSPTANTDVEALRRQVEELQREIDRVKSRRSGGEQQQ